MSTIATLAVGLIAQYEGFVSNMATAERSVAGFERSHLSLRRVMEETRTPAERYEQQIQQLSTWLEKGRIDTETFERAQEKAREAMKRSEDGAKAEGGALETLHGHFERITHYLEFFGAYEGARKLIEFGHGAFEAAEQTEHMAAAMGLTTQQFGRLQYAAEVTGVGTETLATSIERMEKNLGEASLRGGETAAQLEHFGFRIQELRAMAPDAAFREVAKSIEAIQNPVDRATAAFSIFGRGYAQIIPLLEKGSEGLDDFAAKADKSGYALSAQQVAATVDAIEKTREFDMTLAALGRQFVIGLAPFIEVAAHKMQDWSDTVGTASGRTSGMAGMMITAGVAIADAWQPVYNFLRYVDDGVVLLAHHILYVVGAFTSLGAMLQDIGNAVEQKIPFVNAPNYKGKGLDAIDDWVHRQSDLLYRTADNIEAGIDASHQPGNSFGDRLKKSLQDAQDETKKLLDHAHELGGIGGGEGLFGTLGGGRQSEADRLISQLQEQIDTFGMAKGAIEAYKVAMANADPVTQAYANSLGMIVDALEANKKAAEESDHANRKLFEEFSALTKKAEDPLDTFMKHMADMQKLLDSGAIGFGDYAAAMGGAMLELQKGMEPFNRAMDNLTKLNSQLLGDAAKEMLREQATPRGRERAESPQVIDSAYMKPIFGEGEIGKSEGEKQTEELRRLNKTMDHVADKLPSVSKY